MKRFFALVLVVLSLTGTVYADTLEQINASASSFDYAAVKKEIQMEDSGYILEENPQTHNAFINSERFSVSKCSFEHENSSNAYYSYFYNDWIVLNYDSNNPIPIWRLWIYYSSIEPINATAVTFSFAGTDYTFEQIFYPASSLSKYENGDSCQEIVIVFGEEHLAFISDLQNYIFQPEVTSYNEMMALPKIKVTFHGTKDISTELPNTFLVDFIDASFIPLGDMTLDDVLAMSENPNRMKTSSSNVSLAKGTVSLTMNPDEIERLAQSVLMLEVYDQKNTLIATGSGFVAVDSSLLFTNYHVIEGAYKVVAISDDNQRYTIEEICSLDEERDLALLKMPEDSNIPALQFAINYTPKRAESVVAIGSPIGFKNTVSIGNISAVYQEDGISYIHFTAPISQGSSGGALFNSDGNVIGITSAYYKEAQNLNIAIDSSEIVDFFSKWDRKAFTFNKYNEKDYFSVIYFEDYFRVNIPQVNMIIELPYEWTVSSTRWINDEVAFYLRNKTDTGITLIIATWKGGALTSGLQKMTLGDYEYVYINDSSDKLCTWSSDEVAILFGLNFEEANVLSTKGPAATKYIEKAKKIIATLREY